MSTTLLKSFNDFPKAELCKKDRFNYLTYIIDIIVREKNTYLIFGENVRNYISYNYTKDNSECSDIIRVLINPLVANTFVCGQNMLKDFGVFISQYFKGFEVYRSNEYKEVNTRSFAIPYLKGPNFATTIYTLARIDVIAIDHKLNNFYRDFDVNSLVYSSLGFNTLYSVVNNMRYKTITNMGLELNNLLSIVSNIENKRCVSMTSVNPLSLKELILKGYSCYLLVSSFEEDKYIFLKIVKDEDNIVKINTVLFRDGKELENKNVEKIFSGLYLLKDIDIIINNFLKHKCNTVIEDEEDIEDDDQDEEDIEDDDEEDIQSKENDVDDWIITE